jgi:hypothetical protein
MYILSVVIYFKMETWHSSGKVKRRQKTSSLETLQPLSKIQTAWSRAVKINGADVGFILNMFGLIFSVQIVSRGNIFN